MVVRRVKAYAALGALVAAGLGAGSGNARLADAAEERDTTAVVALVKQRVDVNAPQPDGATALHWAAHWDDLAMTRVLLAAGARPNAANDYGVTPLILAATNGSAAVLRALLEVGGNPNATLPTGETVLMTAARSGSVAAVERLLAGGADPNAAQVSKGQTALMWAATAQKVDVAKALIANGAKVSAKSKAGFTPLLFAAREGSIDLTRVLLASGAGINESAPDGNTPLLVATIRGHTALAQFLLDQGAKPDGDPSKAGYTPLHSAVSRSEHPFAPKDADLSGEWGSLGGVSDRTAKLALIDSLLAHGANIEAQATRPPARGPRGATPFLVAAASGDAPLMRLLVAKGARPFGFNPDGSSAVVSVIQAGNAFSAQRITEEDRIDVLKMLLEQGADLEEQDGKGYRAMHAAASAEFHKIILFLISQGADLNPVTVSRMERDGLAGGTVMVAGQSPLGVVEGTFNGGTYNERPETAAFLRTLGAKSIGRATLQTYVQQQQPKPLKNDQPQPQDPPK